MNSSIVVTLESEYSSFTSISGAPVKSSWSGLPSTMLMVQLKGLNNGNPSFPCKLNVDNIPKLTLLKGFSVSVCKSDIFVSILYLSRSFKRS